MACFPTASSLTGTSFYFEIVGRCSKPADHDCWRRCADDLLRSFLRKVLPLPALLVVLVLFASGLLSWVANFGYVGQHQAPLFLRECILALALSASAIMGKGAQPSRTKEVISPEVSL